MNVLLDTCALLALAQGTLPPRAASALRLAPEAAVSVVSPWEIAIKVAAGRLRLGVPPKAWFNELLVRYRLRELPLDSALAFGAAGLPAIHRDPFDRILVALAQTHSLTLLTCDDTIPKYPNVKTLW
jgi:PIN domain nuclease of toxin-antitoxin system